MIILTDRRLLRTVATAEAARYTRARHFPWQLTISTHPDGTMTCMRQRWGEQRRGGHTRMGLVSTCHRRTYTTRDAYRRPCTYVVYIRLVVYRYTLYQKHI